MFTRLRWFLYGVATAMGATVLVVSRARAMCERLDARGVARATALVTADGIEAVGKRLQRSSLRLADDGRDETPG